MKKSLTNPFLNINSKPRVILIGDDVKQNSTIQKMLTNAGYETDWTLTGNEAINTIAGNDDEILLVENKLPDMDTSQFIEILTEKYGKVPVFIVMTSSGNVQQAIDMMRLGAKDYVIKDLYFIDNLKARLLQIIDSIEKDRRLNIAETELERSKFKYYDLFNKMINGFAIHEVIQDQKGDVIDYVTLEVNPAYEELLNIKKEFVLGKRMSEILSKEEVLRWSKILGPVAIDGNPIRYEAYSEHFERYFEGIAFSPERGKFSVTFSDVTKRKKAEKEIDSINQQLKASEQQLKASNQQLAANEQQLRAANQQLKANELELRKSKIAAESYLNIAAEIILKLNTRGEVTLLNDSGYKLLEYEKGDLEGKNWFNICIPDDLKEGLNNRFHEKIKLREDLLNYDLDVITKTGNRKT